MRHEQMKQINESNFVRQGKPSAPWHALPACAAIKALETDPETGLDEQTAKTRLTRYGPNRLQVTQRTHWYQILARQFVDVLIAILLIAAVISFAIGETGDAMTIMAIVVLNGILGFIQEWKAEQAMAALLVAAYKAWLEAEEPQHTVSEFSFNSNRKRMTVIEHRPDGLMADSKGAPEVMLARCSQILIADQVRPFSETDKQQAIAAYTEMAEKGLRTLALARRSLPENITLDEDAVERELTLLGIVGIIDPPRPEVREAVRVARQAGVRPIMITGDAAPTAQAIAQRIGMPVARTITGVELDHTNEEDLRGALQQEVVFARTQPDHKLRIVALLQEWGVIFAAALPVFLLMETYKWLTWRQRPL